MILSAPKQCLLLLQRFQVRVLETEPLSPKIFTRPEVFWIFLKKWGDSYFFLVMLHYLEAKWAACGPVFFGVPWFC